MPSKTKKHIIEYRNYFLPAEFPVLLLTGEKWKLSDVPQESLHFHNCLEIGICQSESGIMRFSGNQSVFFTSGDMTCIPRNIPHSTYASPSTRCKWSYLFLDPRLLFMDMIPSGSSAALLQEEAGNYLIPRGKAPRLTFLMKASIDELSREAPDYMLAKSYLFALYTELTRFQSKRSPAAPDSEAAQNTPPRSNFPPAGSNAFSIAPALDFIEISYMNKFPIEQLAELCHLSQTHFRRVFQSVMHTTPLTYLNSIRIMNACNLLRNTNHTILAIAEMTGFSTLSNFNRHFSRMVGISPRDYRKQMLQDRVSDARTSIMEYPGWMEP